MYLVNYRCIWVNPCMNAAPRSGLHVTWKNGLYEIVDYEHAIRCMGRAPYDVSTELFSDALWWQKHDTLSQLSLESRPGWESIYYRENQILNSCSPIPENIILFTRCSLKTKQYKHKCLYTIVDQKAQQNLLEYNLST